MTNSEIKHIQLKTKIYNHQNHPLTWLLPRIVTNSMPTCRVLTYRRKSESYEAQALDAYALRKELTKIIFLSNIFTLGSKLVTPINLP